MEKRVHFGDIYFAYLGNSLGSEQAGHRPVVCVQNNRLCKGSPTVVVVPITSKAKPSLMTHVYIPKGTGGLVHDSCAMAEQIRTIDKTRLSKHAGVMPPHIMKQIYRSIRCLVHGERRNNKRK